MNEQIAAKEFGITVIDTGYLRAQFAASHMIVENGKAAFVDVGTTYSTDALVEALHNAGLTNDDVLYIIVTHIHLDHAGGSGSLMQLFPNAQFVVHEKGARHMVSPEKLIAGSRAVYGDELYEQLYGEIVPVPESRVVIAEDGLELDFNGRILHFLDTPGHARHHCCVWDPRSCGVFTGDAMGLAYPELQREEKGPFLICTTSPSAFEPDVMIESIERIMELKPARFYLTHYGPVTADPDAVAKLTALVKDHKEAGVRCNGDIELLAAEIGTQIKDGYTAYLGKETEFDIVDFIKSDITMNSQGVSVWFSRMQGK